MRINVYSQELTSEVVHVIKESDTGVPYHAAQLVLHSSPMLHHPPMGDDRSAITFWLPKSAHRCEEIAGAFEAIARIFRKAPPDTDAVDPMTDNIETRANTKKCPRCYFTPCRQMFQCRKFEPLPTEDAHKELHPTKPLPDPNTCRRLAAQITAQNVAQVASQDAVWLDNHELVVQLLAAAKLAEELQHEIEQLNRRGKVVDSVPEKQGEP